MNDADRPNERMPEELRRVAYAQRKPMEIIIGNVDFPTKIDALAAALQSVLLAHQHEISAKSWALLNEVERLLMDAVFYRNDRRVIDASKPGGPFLE